MNTTRSKPANYRSTRARLGNALRLDPNADTTDLRRQLKAEKLAEHVKRIVDEAPALNAAQRDAIALVLKGAGLANPRVVDGLASQEAA